MENSVTSRVIVCAFKKGYTVDEKGDVYFKNRKRLLNKNSGYYNFTVKAKIDDKNISTRVFVHRLQAYQKFKEKMFEPNIVVRHLNSNELDNSYENISIGSSSDNSFDMPVKRRLSRAIYASSKKIIFSDEEILSINNDRKNGMTYKELCDKYKTSKGFLSYFFNKAYYNNKRVIK